MDLLWAARARHPALPVGSARPPSGGGLTGPSYTPSWPLWGKLSAAHAFLAPAGPTDVIQAGG